MLTRPPSFRAVAAFEAAARHMNFSRAADELNLTQSAISHAIRSLEQRLGVQLFAKAGRNVVLTQEGVRLAKRVRESLSLLADAFDRRPHREQTRLVIGADPGLAARLLTPRLGAFMRQHPHITLELRSATSPAALAAAEIDVAVWTGAGRHLGLCSRVIARDRLWPVGAPSVTRACELADDADWPLIESLQHPWALWFAANRRPASVRAPAISVETDVLAIEMAKAGEGVCLAPSLLMQPELADGSLVRLGEDQVPARWTYNLDWRPASAKLDEIALFAIWIANVLECGAEGRDADALSSADLRAASAA